MAAFSELIRNFDKIRDYMREFSIYGFKSRGEYTKKSARTYDNEKRRIESYLGDYMKWEYTKSGKSFFISLDCAKIPLNPLYSAWKSKSFANNDIMLHFYILDTLSIQRSQTIDQLTDSIVEKSGILFDTQVVRNKCKEYINHGLLESEKIGKTLYYRLSPIYFSDFVSKTPHLKEAIAFYQGAVPFGEVGSYLLDQLQESNESFIFKHSYIVHTLEDEVLFQLLSAIRKNQKVSLINHSRRSNSITEHIVIPLRVFVSTVTGRRYICVYKTDNKRFFNYRIDHITKVTLLEHSSQTNLLQEKLDQNLHKMWGVCFGGSSRIELISMKLRIDEENEKYVLERIAREGQNGKITRLDQNIFLYTCSLFDSYDISPWIKTFIGRIIELEGTNRTVINRFYKDISRLEQMYLQT